MTIQFLEGGTSIDDRGRVSFVNDLKLEDFKRLYLVENHTRHFVRAWHGHKHEKKAVLCISGAAIVAAVKVDNWEKPSENLPLERFILSAEKPGFLVIPAGYANGFMTLEDRTKLLFLSDKILKQSMEDDIRFPARFWNPWEIEER